jgi:hypothetical protein
VTVWSEAQSESDASGLAENRTIAARFRDYAQLLAAQGEDGFRVRAYRNAADEVDALEDPLRNIFQRGGTEALIGLHAIGKGIARAVAEMLTTGRWGQLDRLRGEVAPEALFRTIPGVGPTLAHRLATELDVETLEQLETALRVDRATVAGIGPRRRDAILAALSERLARLRQMTGRMTPGSEPPVGLLLDADSLYRRKAEAGDLRRIAPRRFNPSGEAWLPIMHARRGDWHLTALFSNTALAHRLGRTRDWVVIYFHEGIGPEGSRTVVTQRDGPLEGCRVVRGREEECARHYARTAGAAKRSDSRPETGP